MATAKKTATERQMDQVLTRMLNTPPQPFTPPAKAVKKTKATKKGGPR